jgi:hypothetical protein
MIEDLDETFINPDGKITKWIMGISFYENTVLKLNDSPGPWDIFFFGIPVETNKYFPTNKAYAVDKDGCVVQILEIERENNENR